MSVARSIARLGWPGWPRDKKTIRFFSPRMLKHGAVYAIGVETAAARVGLLAAPLRAALLAGRPCALITPLSPEQFASLLCRTKSAKNIAAAIKDGHLKLFTAIGDYAANLFIRGAAGYVQELDHFELEEGALIVIDQADDLYTPQDHLAVVDQAQTYDEWCKRHAHTMLQLHLRTSLAHPVLEGNQAAIQYFAGLARVTSEAEGLYMRMDFWQSARGYSTGMVIRLDRQLRSVLPGSVQSTTNEASIHSRWRELAAASHQQIWYVGPEDVSLDDIGQQIRWRAVRSLDDLLRYGECKDGAKVLVSLTGVPAFRELITRLVELRSAVGVNGRILVRESGYRLREYPQKRLLLLAGIDHFLADSEPLSALPGLLGAPRLAQHGDPIMNTALLSDYLPVNEGFECGWLPLPRFVHEVRETMRRDGEIQMPCALAEVHLDGSASLQIGVEAANATRTGDLSTSIGDSRLFFLRGCREPDVFRVVARLIERTGVKGLHNVSLFSGESAIAECLARLLPRSEQNISAIETKSPTVLSNVVAMPGMARGKLTPGHLGTALLAATMFCLLLPSTSASASEDVSRGAGVTVIASKEAVERAYQEGRYAEAARLGLIELAHREFDHDLRFKVANSLAWTGQYPEAIRQYRALESSPLASEATVGLANIYLWSGRPELADPLFRRVLKANPDSSDALRGLNAAGRYLRPRTTVKPGWLDDSSNTERSSLNLAHRWRDGSLNQVFELSAEAESERRSPDIPEIRQRDLALSYEHLGMMFMPRIQVAIQESPTSKFFGSAAIRLADGAVTMDVGRVNWGKLVFDPRALKDGLVANRAGIEAKADTAIGAWQAAFAHFSVSDDNRVQDLNARYTPAFQPFPSGSGVRAFIGVYGRKADRKETRYWSPEAGFYTGYFGVAADRSGADWDVYGELKRSQRLGGEGANGWSAGGGGRIWLNRDWAIRADAFWLETRRNESAYRSKSVTVCLEYLW